MKEGRWWMADNPKQSRPLTGCCHRGIKAGQNRSTIPFPLFGFRALLFGVFFGLHFFPVMLTPFLFFFLAAGMFDPPLFFFLYLSHAFSP